MFKRGGGVFRRQFRQGESNSVAMEAKTEAGGEGFNLQWSCQGVIVENSEKRVPTHSPFILQINETTGAGSSMGSASSADIGEHIDADRENLSPKGRAGLVYCMVLDSSRLKQGPLVWAS